MTKSSTLNENAIRPDHLMARSFELLEEDTRRLMQDKDEFVSVTCPACGHVEASSYGTKRGMTFLECHQCETVYGSPRPKPERLAQYYREATYYAYWNKYIYPSSEEARRERIVKPRVERILGFVEQHGIPKRRMIEVGAGTGQFCEMMKQSGSFEEIVAIEPTPSSADSCEKRGLEVLRQPIETVPADKGNAQLIVSFEVLEHLFSPKTYLEHCIRLLAPGGMLVVTCPSAKGFDVSLLRTVADTVTPEHLNLFNPKFLKLLFESNNLEVIELLTPGRLDADIVRKKTMAGKFSLESHPFLKKVLIDEWEQLGEKFQNFLAENLLSSHMWIVARKPSI
jgi:2-polyprenyl-3-methyl-5-hydroxy-6-metoxy-1,4-benzoquinol methylase